MGGDVGAVEEVVDIQIDLVIGLGAVGKVQPGDKEGPQRRLIVLQYAVIEIAAAQRTAPLIFLVLDAAGQVETVVASLLAFRGLAGIIKLRIAVGYTPIRTPTVFPGDVTGQLYP